MKLIRVVTAAALALVIWPPASALAQQQKQQGGVVFEGEAGKIKTKAPRERAATSEYIKIGDNLADDNKWAEAEAQYSVAVRLEPNNAVWRYKLYFSQLENRKYNDSARESDRIEKLKRWPAIEEACRRSVALKSQRAWRHAALARALDGQGKYAEAEAAYKAALRADPNFALAKENLDRLLKKKN